MSRAFLVYSYNKNIITNNKGLTNGWKSIFITRQRCQLCEDAKLILQLMQSDFSFEINEIDIDKSDELTEKYGIMIPVVEIEGEVVQYGIIDLVTLEEQLKKHIN